MAVDLAPDDVALIDELVACFVSDLEARILQWQPQLWLHGHTHDSFDYRIGGTRVVANPRGYAPDGVVENTHFDAAFVIELPTSRSSTKDPSP